METKLELPPELPEDEEILAKELKEQQEAEKMGSLPIQVRRLKRKLSPRTRERHRHSLRLYFRSLDKNEPANKDFQIGMLGSSPTDEDEEKILKMFTEGSGANGIVPESWLKIQELMGGKAVTRVEGSEEDEEERAARALFSKRGKGDRKRPKSSRKKGSQKKKKKKKKSGKGSSKKKKGLLGLLKKK